MIADAQALTDNIEEPEKVRQNIIEVALDYMSCGLDPARSTMFIQSQISELCELTFYYMDLVTVARLQRFVCGQKGGRLHQHRRIDRVKLMHNLPGLLDHGKLVIPHRNRSCLKGCDVRRLTDWISKKPYRYAGLKIPHLDLRGGLGDMKVKKFLNNVMQELLEPIRTRRKELEKDIPAIYEILKKGTDSGEQNSRAKSSTSRPACHQLLPPYFFRCAAAINLDAFCKPEHFGRYLPDYGDLDELKAHYQRGGLGDMKVTK